MDSCDATFDILKKLSHAGVLQVFGLTLFFFGGGGEGGVTFLAVNLREAKIFGSSALR